MRARVLETPFNEVDEAFLHLSRPDEPDSIQLELRAPGPLEEGTLRAAVAHALRLHPMARARQAPGGPLRLQHTWEIPESPSVEPLGVVACPDDEALARARMELLGRLLPLGESPPVRLRLARHPDGDVLMLHARHAAMDGVGALRLLRSVVRAYAGEPDVLPDVDPLSVRDLRQQLAARSYPEQLARWEALLRAQAEAWVEPPARVASDGARAAPGYGFVLVRLSSEEVARLEWRREVGGTLNDLLLAALHRTIDWWNRAHGQAPRRISTYVPVNLRPSGWRFEVVGNLSLSATVSSLPEDRRDPRSLLACIARQTRRIKETGEAAALVELLGPAPLTPLFLKQALPGLMALSGERFLPTAILSNLGELPEALSLGPGAEATGLWLSPPVRMPMGLAVGAVSLGGALHLSLRYRHALMDARAAGAFSEEFVRALSPPRG